MKARVPEKSAVQQMQAEYEESLKKMQAEYEESLKKIQEEYDRCLEINTNNARDFAIKMCVVVMTQSLVDVGLADSTMEKISRKNKSYIQSIKNGNVEYQEIAQCLEEENGITFDWMEGGAE